MDFLTYALGSVALTLFAVNYFDYKQPKMFRQQMKKWFIVVLSIIVAMFTATNYILSYTEIDEVHDVQTYDGISFSIPKTIIVETTWYPQWSVLSTKTEYHVKDQNQTN